MNVMLASIQWAMFIVAGSIVAPLTIGFAYHLPLGEIGSLLQRCLFVIGIGSFIQIVRGHKLPIVEGPAGLWWGVFLIFGNFASSLHINEYEILQSLEMGLLISGLFLLILGFFHRIEKMKSIFTPMVTGTYLFLLMIQLSGPLIKGILGIDYLKPYIDYKVALGSLLTLGITVLLGKSSYPKVRSFSILYGMIFGWILFKILGIIKPLSIEFDQGFSAPSLFYWGPPKMDIGIVIISIITALLLLSNLIASMEVVKRSLGDLSVLDYNRAGWVMGINQILAGIFSTLGFVPVTTSAGFIITTKIKEKLPFIIGSMIVVFISFFPPITLFFSSIPTPVGYAVTFLPFSNLIVMALREYEKMKGEDERFIAAVSIIVGVGAMFISSESLKYLPRFLAPLFNNGLMMGVITSMVLQEINKKS